MKYLKNYHDLNERILWSKKFNFDDFALYKNNLYQIKNIVKDLSKKENNILCEIHKVISINPIKIVTLTHREPFKPGDIMMVNENLLKLLKIEDVEMIWTAKKYNI